MTNDQISYHPKNRFSMLKIAGIYMPFNESFGNYIGDLQRPETQINLQASPNNIVWEWDPFVARIC